MKVRAREGDQLSSCLKSLPICSLRTHTGDRFREPSLVVHTTLCEVVIEVIDDADVGLRPLVFHLLCHGLAPPVLLRIYLDGAGGIGVEIMDLKDLVSIGEEVFVVNLGVAFVVEEEANNVTPLKESFINSIFVLLVYTSASPPI